MRYIPLFTVLRQILAPEEFTPIHGWPIQVFKSAKQIKYFKLIKRELDGEFSIQRTSTKTQQSISILIHLTQQNTCQRIGKKKTHHIGSASKNHANLAPINHWFWRTSRLAMKLLFLSQNVDLTRIRLGKVQGSAAFFISCCQETIRKDPTPEGPSFDENSFPSFLACVFIQRLCCLSEKNWQFEEKNIMRCSCVRKNHVRCFEHHCVRLSFI